MKVPTERTLADKQREIVRTWVAPAAAGLSVGGHHEWRESLSPARRFDEIDELVGELRAAELDQEETQP